MKYDWFNIDSEQRSAWEALCPVGEFRVLGPGSLPGPMPASLTDKFESTLMLASGCPDGAVFFMLNGNRLEKPSRREPSGAIDQQPFGIAFLGDKPVGSGCLVQHGNWPNRTTSPPPEFWPQIRASGIGQVYPLAEMPERHAGSLSDLKVNSQEDAFTTLIDRIGAEFL